MQALDPGRVSIQPAIDAGRRLWNRSAGRLGAGRIDGTSTPDELIDVIEVAGAAEVVLATDGYIAPRSTLDESERLLAERIAVDPLMIDDPPQTKGVAPGASSFDGRRDRLSGRPGLGSLDVMAAPDLAAARRAAEQLVDAGAGRVLVFGSVARGEATEDSDIDLVAIFDDLGDYSTRSKQRCALEAKARAATGCPVDVIVTDSPEWAVRTTKVPCSVESRLAGDAIELADTGSHAGIDWDKEIGLPADPTAELAARFREMYKAASELDKQLQPSEGEAAAVDTDHRREQESDRFALAMSQVHLIVESAAKATYIIDLRTAPPWKHEIAELLASQSEPIRQAFYTLAGGSLDLAALHLWRQSNYLEDRPELPGEDSLREQCDAALSIGTYVADACRRQGIAERYQHLWNHHSSRVSEKLDGPIRRHDDPCHGLSL